MDIFSELKLTKVINADGRMTILGVSTFSETVGEALKLGGQSYFIMSELEDKIDNEIAKLYGAPSAHAVNSASAGIALGVAAAIYGPNIHDVHNLKYQKKEIILPKGQNVDYGAPIEDVIKLVGGHIVEAGYANTCREYDVECRITENTAALMYVVSHHAVQKQMISLEKMVAISQKHKIPLIVDCAAESDIEKYVKMNIELIIFSGAKAIEGPTSGIVFGNPTIVNNIKKHHKNIGRTMKIGKENLVGIYVAMKEYKKPKPKIDVNKYLEVMNKNKYINCELSKDPLRDITRIKFTLNKDVKINCEQLTEKLKNSNPSIYLRDYFAKQGWLEIDLRSIDLKQVEIINDQIIKIIGVK